MKLHRIKIFLLCIFGSMCAAHSQTVSCVCVCVYVCVCLFASLPRSFVCVSVCVCVCVCVFTKQQVVELTPGFQISCYIRGMGWWSVDVLP